MATKKSTDTETTALNSVEATEEKLTEEKTTETVTEVVTEASYLKDQITSSKKYLNYVDVLNTILDNRRYTLREVDQLLKEFLESEV